MNHQERMANVEAADSGRLQSILLANFSERITQLEEEVERTELEVRLWMEYCNNAWLRMDEAHENVNTTGQLLERTRVYLTEALDERDALLDLLSRICHENQAIQRVYGPRIRQITGVLETADDIIDLTHE